MKEKKLKANPWEWKDLSIFISDIKILLPLYF